MLTLQLPPTFAARWMLPRLPGLKQALPGLEIRIATQRGQVFDTLDLALSAATRGQGVAIADPLLLRESLADGVLALPFERQVPSGLRYYLTYPARRAPQRKLQRFQAWLLAALSGASPAPAEPSR